jgi:hypothetical protein
MENISYHQKLMNEAYASFKKLSYDEFINQLDEKHKVAVILGNLNYQVGNGGFSQWYYNNYHKAFTKYAGILNTAISKIDNRVISPRFYELKKAISYALLAIDSIDDANDAYGEDEDEIDYSTLDKLDDRFYELKNLESQMEDLLISL